MFSSSWAVDRLGISVNSLEISVSMAVSSAVRCLLWSRKDAARTCVQLATERTHAPPAARAARRTTREEEEGDI